MSHSLVSFYREEEVNKGGTDPTHQVLVKSYGGNVVKKAKDHFRMKGVPNEELSFHTVINYGQGLIENVELI